MKLKWIGVLCCVFVVVFCVVACAQGCLHPSLQKIAERTTYRKDIDGHYVDLVTKFFCSTCGYVMENTSSSFEGHDYMNTGNEHVHGTLTHFTFYQCMKCSYTTEKSYHCSGNPCYIALNGIIDEESLE